MTISEAHVGRSYPHAAVPHLAREDRGVRVRTGRRQPGLLRRDPRRATDLRGRDQLQAWGSLFDDPELGLALHPDRARRPAFHLDASPARGDDVTAVLTIEKVRNRGTADMVTVRVDLTSTLVGEHVCSATSTLLHSPPDRGGRRMTATPAIAAAVGDQLPVLEVAITREGAVHVTPVRPPTSTPSTGPTRPPGPSAWTGSSCTACGRASRYASSPTGSATRTRRRLPSCASRVR